MTLPPRSVLFNAQGAQNPDHQDRGIARYTLEQMRAILKTAPEVVAGIALSADRPMTRRLDQLVGAEHLRWLRPDRPPGGTPPAIFHVLSPFELPRPLEDVWPTWARTRATRLVVTLYDLIPLIYESHYLRDPRLRAHYLARADALRGADLLLAISERTAADAVERLEIDEDRVQVIDAGVAADFLAAAPDRDSAGAILRAELPNVRPGYLLYVAGIEFRKNIERLIEGYARMPAAARRRHQLVITCRVTDVDRRRLETLAAEHGIQPGELLLTGYVEDRELAALYRCCHLFVFASFYEGSGLPILEAMAADAPVAASVTATTPELFGDLDATFDPFDTEDIGATLTALVDDDAHLERLRERSRARVQLYTWERVAERTLAGYESVLARIPDRPRRRRHIAWWTPWPPDPSGVATYSSRLVPELAQTVDVDIIAPGNSYPGRPPRHTTLVHAAHARDVEALRHYDRVVYSMGNSEFHLTEYEALRQRRGVVVCHDVRLLGFYRWYAQLVDRLDPFGWLADKLAEMYPFRALPADFTSRWPTLEEERRLQLFMSHEIQRAAQLIIVHSEHAAQLLRDDRPADLADPPEIVVIPHGLLPRPIARGGRPARDGLMVVSLGLLSEIKQLDRIIDAFARIAVAHPQAELVLAGPGGEAEEERWRAHAETAGVGERVRVTGYVSADEYERLLTVADIAVQLRAHSNGEASGAITDCLAAGVPTIVTDEGWSAELSSDAVERVPVDVDAEALADLLAALIDAPERRGMLREAGRRYAESTSYRATAQQYLDVLGLR